MTGREWDFFRRFVEEIFEVDASVCVFTELAFLLEFSGVDSFLFSFVGHDCRWRRRMKELMWWW
jgi:hypothetical protein